MLTNSFAISNEPCIIKNNSHSFEEFGDKSGIVKNFLNSDYYEYSDFDLNEKIQDVSKWSSYRKENLSEDLTDNINYNKEENIHNNNILSNDKIFEYSYDDDIKYFLRKVIERKNIFEVVYPLFTFSRKENDLIKYCGREECLQPLKKGRSSKKLRRRYLRFNIRVKIKRAFLNILIIKLNKIIKQIEGKSLLKFGQKFSSNVNKSTNEKILNMTLYEIFDNIDLYEDTNLINYYYNKEIVDNLRKKENIKLNKIFNMKYRDIFEEYINSDEFKIEEINRLKKKKMQDDYIKKYIMIAYNFIQFYSN